MSAGPWAERSARVRAGMAEAGVDVLLLSVGADLPWLTGYQAMPLERLTMLVLPRDGDATLVVPRLEAPRVIERPDVFSVRPWEETDDPIQVVVDLLGSAPVLGVGDQTWGRFVVDLVNRVSGATWRQANDVTGPIRARKDAAEVAALRAAGHAADAVAAQLQGGEVPLVGRTEAEVSADLSRRLLEAGHHEVNFAIVAAGPSAASPHHEAGERVIAAGDVVLCDFGGTMPGPDGGPAGYCSDITRCVVAGGAAAPAEVAEAYVVLHEAQAAAVSAATVGRPCEAVDGVARSIIEQAGYGERFVHRTGHGIGLDAHEDPYLVSGNSEPLAPGHAFSIEPGIYTPGAWGLRLEDIVVAADAGPDPLNLADHALISVDA
jgi:Xaa-Pro aminopeptidase